MNFPIFRKYPNNKSFFKVTAHDSFEEIKFTGQVAEIFSVKAKIHPDRMFIADMIKMTDGHWVEIDALQFEQALSNMKQRQ